MLEVGGTVQLCCLPLHKVIATKILLFYWRLSSYYTFRIYASEKYFLWKELELGFSLFISSDILYQLLKNYISVNTREFEPTKNVLIGLFLHRGQMQI